MTRFSSRSSLRSLLSLSLLAAALPFLPACAGESSDTETVDTQDDALQVVTKGVDYAWDRPSLSHLKSEGYTFVVRYLSYDKTGKNISPSEATSIKNAGLDIVLNWEWGANDALDGYSRGVEHAKAAAAQADAVNAPKDRPIYFSLDFDATPGQQGAINAYFDGVASVIGRARTGAYGGYYPIKRLFDAGKIKWGWQTYAWSGGQWDARCQLRQVQNGVEGGGADKDEAMATDFGQWGKVAPPAPPPAAHDAGSLGGNVASEPAVFSNADGRLEVFAVGPKGNAQTTFQTAPNGGWSGWFSLGGNVAGRPAVAPNQDGRLEIFARGTGGGLDHAWQDAPNGKVGNFVSLGGPGTGNPAVAKNHDGRLEAFMSAGDGAIHHVWQKTANGNWSGWASLGEAGGGLGEPRAILAHDGTLRVFAVGKDGATYTKGQDSGGWSAWTSLGGKATSDVTVTKNADGRLEIFVRGTDGALYHRWEESPNGKWSGWTSLGGGIHAPFAATDADGRIEVFVRGDGAGHLFRIAQNAPGTGWGSWTSMGGAVSDGPAAARNKDGRLEVFFRATDGSVQHSWEAAPEKW